MPFCLFLYNFNRYRAVWWEKFSCWQMAPFLWRMACLCHVSLLSPVIGLQKLPTSQGTPTKHSSSLWCLQELQKGKRDRDACSILVREYVPLWSRPAHSYLCLCFPNNKNWLDDNCAFFFIKLVSLVEKKENQTPFWKYFYIDSKREKRLKLL